MSSRRHTIRLSIVVLAAVLAVRPVAGATPPAESCDALPEHTIEASPAVLATPVAAALAKRLGATGVEPRLGDPTADAEVLRAVYGERRVVRLSVPVPVHLTYVTAWAGEGGSINFRKDVYERDRRLEQALFGGE